MLLIRIHPWPPGRAGGVLVPSSALIAWSEGVAVVDLDGDLRRSRLSPNTTFTRIQKATAFVTGSRQSRVASRSCKRARAAQPTFVHQHPPRSHDNRPTQLHRKSARLATITPGFLNTWGTPSPSRRQGHRRSEEWPQQEHISGSRRDFGVERVLGDSWWDSLAPSTSIGRMTTGVAAEGRSGTGSVPWTRLRRRARRLPATRPSALSRKAAA